MLVQDTRLFAVDSARDDDVHALGLGTLDDLVRVIGFVCQQRLGLQPTRQLGHRLGVMPLTRGQYKAQWIAQCIAQSVDFGIEARRA